MDRHPATFLDMDQLGSQYPPYQPTFPFAGAFIDGFHESLARSPVKNGILVQLRNRRWFGSRIPGWLRRADALKLYEIAYFVQGDVLELGSYHGLSTTILSRAGHNSPYKKHVYSVDLNPRCVRAARHNLAARGLGGNVTSICGDAADAVRALIAQGKRFALVFVDHSHTYEDVYRVCRELGEVTMQGGFCLFHDFNDLRNRDPENAAYGVYQAVMDGLGAAEFEFYGVYGCTALYRSTPSGTQNEENRAAASVEVLRGCG